MTEKDRKAPFSMSEERSEVMGDYCLRFNVAKQEVEELTAENVRLTKRLKACKRDAAQHKAAMDEAVEIIKTFQGVTAGRFYPVKDRAESFLKEHSDER